MHRASRLTGGSAWKKPTWAHTFPVCIHVGFFRSMRKVHRSANAKNASEKHLEEPKPERVFQFQREWCVVALARIWQGGVSNRPGRIVP